MKAVHSDLITEALESEIMSGKLKPGKRLSESSLAERFGVSRTPVREALQNIVTRSLADRVPYKGVVVRDVDERRVQEMFEAMAMIEAACGGLAAMRMTADQMASLKKKHRALSDLAGYHAAKEYEAMNVEFHTMIYEFSCNKDLAVMASEMRVKLAPFRKSQLYQTERMAESNREHALIVSLFEARNSPGVEQALKDHLRGASQAFFRPRESESQA